MPFTLTSPAFHHEGPIPARYTCDGANVSPPLAWREAPASTVTFALICDDPDAPRGTFVHWVLWDLPATVHSLPEAVPTAPILENGARQGRNSAGGIGYTGPCPPSGTHRYFFTLYALDSSPDVIEGATKDELLFAIRGHVLEDTQLMGRYARAVVAAR